MVEGQRPTQPERPRRRRRRRMTGPDSMRALEQRRASMSPEDLEEMARTGKDTGPQYFKSQGF